MLLVSFLDSCKVFQQWREISHVIRYRVFENHEEEEIDIHDVTVS